MRLAAEACRQEGGGLEGVAQAAQRRRAALGAGVLRAQACGLWAPCPQTTAGDFLYSHASYLVIVSRGWPWTPAFGEFCRGWNV